MYEVINSDCLAHMKTMADNSVDSIVTDPPYEIGMMGKAWDSSGIAYNVEMWKECLRILKPGGHLLAFSAARTYHRMTCAIEDAGFEIRDQLMWVYAASMPKALDVSKAIGKDGETEAAKQWNGWKSSLKPCHEPICMARKPLVGTIASNVLEYGTGALNIDACRVPHVTVEGANLSVNTHLRKSIKGGNGGRIIATETDSRENIPSALGRFPGNFVHDGSEEVIKLFPNSNGAGKSVPKVKVTGYGSGIGNGESKYIGGERIPFENGSGSAARFFYSAKASQADRDEGLESKNPHISVKPTSLMCWMVKMVTPPNGIVFDPFVGSGSTGKAAVKEGFNFIGTELSPEYTKVAEQRIEFEQQLKKTHLF